MISPSLSATTELRGGKGTQPLNETDSREDGGGEKTASFDSPTRYRIYPIPKE